MTKTSQIQLRVSPSEKAELVRRSRAAGLDLSAYMLDRLLPKPALRFAELTRKLAEPEGRVFVLAEVHDLLARAARVDFARIVEVAPPAGLSLLLQNQLAAMVETRAAELRVAPPAWVSDVKELDAPWFASDLLSLRLHLLMQSPPAFRRRNLFIDSTVGSRV
jgi:hypothetical protein